MAPQHLEGPEELSEFVIYFIDRPLPQSGFKSETYGDS